MKSIVICSFIFSMTLAAFTVSAQSGPNIANKAGNGINGQFAPVNGFNGPDSQNGGAQNQIGNNGGKGGKGGNGGNGSNGSCNCPAITCTYHSESHHSSSGPGNQGSNKPNQQKGESGPNILNGALNNVNLQFAPVSILNGPKGQNGGAGNSIGGGDGSSQCSCPDPKTYCDQNNPNKGGKNNQGSGPQNGGNNPSIGGSNPTQGGSYPSNGGTGSSNSQTNQATATSSKAQSTSQVTSGTSPTNNAGSTANTSGGAASSASSASSTSSSSSAASSG